MLTWLLLAACIAPAPAVTSDVADVGPFRVEYGRRKLLPGVFGVGFRAGVEPQWTQWLSVRIPKPGLRLITLDLITIDRPRTQPFPRLLRSHPSLAPPPTVWLGGSVSMPNRPIRLFVGRVFVGQAQVGTKPKRSIVPQGLRKVGLAGRF